jgi:multicomponent Na+:H+ antiporter subunit E
MRSLALFILLFGFWLIFTFSLKADHLIVGAALSLVITLFFRKYFVDHVGKFLQPKRYAWGLIYLIIFVWECVKANFDVAYRVIHPDLPIHPGIVKVRLNLQNDMARAILANSITMTPGTITVDIQDDYIYIHWINIRGQRPEEYSHRICGKFEKYIGRIFE